MSDFTLYLRLGFEHIADLQGYDHILFIVALCAVYMLQDWRELVWLVTAFTVGHSVTLALATLDLVRIPSDVVEFLIPVTIVATALVNIVAKPNASPQLARSSRIKRTKYGLALGFGLIHGLGFSNFLRSLLGAEESLFVPLLAFNIGLELGQLAIVGGFLLTAWLLVRKAGMIHREWTLVLSGAAGGIALLMLLERWPW